MHILRMSEDLHNYVHCPKSILFTKMEGDFLSYAQFVRLETSITYQDKKTLMHGDEFALGD